jgi:hypothetical protein
LVSSFTKILSMSHIGIFFHGQKVARLCPKEKPMAIHYIQGLTLYFYSNCNWRGVLCSPIKDLIHLMKNWTFSFFLSFFLLEKGNALKPLFPRIWNFQSPNMWLILSWSLFKPIKSSYLMLYLGSISCEKLLWVGVCMLTLCLEVCMSCSNFL